MLTNHDIRHIGDVTILDLQGRLSLGEAVAFGPGSGLVLGDTVRELARKGHKKLVLNLADVTYVDSSGVGQLVGALTTARNQGADLKLLSPAAAVRELLRTTNLVTVFDIKNDEAAALQAFAKGTAATA